MRCERLVVCRRIDRQNGVISMPLISGKLRMMQRHPAYQCSSTFTKRSMFPPDDLLRDELGENEISKIHEIEMLWRESLLPKQELLLKMIKAALKYQEK